MTLLRFSCLGALVGALATSWAPPAVAQQAIPTDSGTDSLVIAAAKTRLTTALMVLGLAQEAYRPAYGRYAASVRSLRLTSAFWLDPSASVIILRAGLDGWSAIAADTLIPEVRCATHAGKTKPPFEDQSVEADVSCETDHYPPRALVDSNRTFTEIQRPQQLGCDVRELPIRLEHPGRVLLQFVLDQDGHPEPRSIRFIASPDLLDDMAALVVLSGCKFRPGQVGDKHVRVLIQWPVNLKQ